VTDTPRRLEGETRVTLPVMSFPTHLKVVCGHLRQGGLERHPRVSLELLRLLGAVADVPLSERRAKAVRREVEPVLDEARRTAPSSVDLEDALQLGADVLGRLHAVRQDDAISPRAPSAMLRDEEGP
jgi:uncharacterized membrane protein